MTPELRTFQHRFICYAKYLKRTPEQVLDEAELKWPGGKMSGFILWTNAQWAAWSKATGRSREFLSNEDHQAFDAWLAARVSL